MPQAPPTIIDDPIPAYLPVASRLTDPIPEPAPPAPLCMYHGAPAYCVLDGLLWIEDWRGLLKQANTDRATTAIVTHPAAKP